MQFVRRSDPDPVQCQGPIALVVETPYRVYGAAFMVEVWDDLFV